MKTFKISLLALAIGISNLAFSQHDHHKKEAVPAHDMSVIDIGKTDETVKKQMNNVLLAYYGVKNALVATDGKTANEKAKTLLSALKAVDSQKLTSAQNEVFKKLAKHLLFDAEHITETESVEHQRDHFGDLSKNIFAMVKSFKITDTVVYYDYCPMAFDNKGGFWLSEQKTIANPYFGKKMMTCGSVKETLINQ